MQSFLNPIAFAMIEKEQIENLTNQNYEELAIVADERIYQEKKKEQMQDAKFEKYSTEKY